MENKQVDLLDILLILAKHKKFIFWTVLIVSVVSVIYSLLVPQIWTSTAVITSVDDSQNSYNFSGSSLLGYSALLGGVSSNSSQEFVTIMNSRTFSEKVIREFNIISLYDIQESDSLIAMDMAREILKEKIRDIYFDDENGVIVIRINTVDKVVSKKMANYYWKELEKYNQKYNVTTETRKRMFIEERLTEVEKNIMNQSNDLLRFMEENNTIQLDSQTAAIVDLYSELLSQKLKNNIEIGVKEKMYDKDSSQLSQLKILKDEIANQIKELEFSENKNNKYSINLNSIPKLTVELANIKLNLSIQKEIYEYLYPQYEQAKIQEIKDFPTIRVIDKAKIAGKRSYPKRARLCITNFILSIILSVFIAFLLEYFQNNRDRSIRFKQNLLKYK